MLVKLVGINARFSHSTLALFYVRNELESRCPQLRCEICQLTVCSQLINLFIGHL